MLEVFILLIECAADRAPASPTPPTDLLVSVPLSIDRLRCSIMILRDLLGYGITVGCIDPDAKRTTDQPIIAQCRCL
jgi:hypothetical protein